MILAQEQLPPVNQLGIWVLCLIVVLVVAEKIKSLFFPSKDAADRDVTKGELSRLKEDIEAKISEVKTSIASFVTRFELQRLEQQLTMLATEHKELATHTYSRYEELKNAINELRIIQEARRREFSDELHKATELLLQRMDDLKVSK